MPVPKCYLVKPLYKPEASSDRIELVVVGSARAFVAGYTGEHLQAYVPAAAAARDAVLSLDHLNSTNAKQALKTWADDNDTTVDIRDVALEAKYCCEHIDPRDEGINLGHFIQGQHIQMIQVTSPVFTDRHSTVYDLFLVLEAGDLGPCSFAAAASQQTLKSLVEKVASSLKKVHGADQGVLVRVSLYTLMTSAVSCDSFEQARHSTHSFGSSLLPQPVAVLLGLFLPVDLLDRRVAHTRAAAAAAAADAAVACALPQLLLLEHAMAQVLAQSRGKPWWADVIEERFEGFTVPTEVNLQYYDYRHLTQGLTDGTRRVLWLGVEAGNQSRVIHLGSWPKEDIFPPVKNGQLVKWSGYDVLEACQAAQAFTAVIISSISWQDFDHNMGLLADVEKLVEDGLSWDDIKNLCTVYFLKNHGRTFIEMGTAGEFEGRALTGNAEQQAAAALPVAGNKHSRGSADSDEGGRVDEWWLLHYQLAPLQSCSFILHHATAYPSEFLQRELAVVRGDRLWGYHQVHAAFKRVECSGFVRHMQLGKLQNGKRSAQAQVLFFGVAGPELTAALQRFQQLRDGGQFAAARDAWQAVVKACKQQCQGSGGLSHLDSSESGFKRDVSKCHGPILLTDTITLRAGPDKLRPGYLWDEVAAGVVLKAKEWGVVLPLASMLLLLFAVPDWRNLLRLDPASRSADEQLGDFFNGPLRIKPVVTQTMVGQLGSSAAVAEPKPKAQGGGGQE